MEEFRDYTVLSEIGRGGMGVVYLAKHKILGNEVALKVIHGQLAEIDESVARARFVQEAMLMAQLNHPNILKLQNCFEDDGRLVIVADLLYGKTLADILEQHQAVGYQFSVHVFSHLLAGIKYAHERNIIHRDLKPSNIFITDDGEVKILDFGVGKQLGSGAQMTATGVVIGTPTYMAPETLRTKNKVSARDVGAEADIYALGIIMYRMLSGTLPFGMDESISAVEALTELAVHYSVYDPIEPIDALCPDLPESFASMIMRCMSLEPSGRPDAATLTTEFNTTQTAPAENSANVSITGTETFFSVESENEEESQQDAAAQEIEKEEAFESGSNPTSTEKITDKLPTPTSSEWQSSPEKSQKRAPIILGVSLGMIVSVIAAVLLIKFIFAPKTGAIELTVSPDDKLSVMVDGSKRIPQKVSPMLIENLEAGQHTFTISRTGYTQKELIFDVLPGKTVASGVQLEKESISTTGMDIETNPPGCTVEIDGKLLSHDTTPLSISGLQPGTSKVTVRKDGYADLKFQVDLEAGKRAKLPIKSLSLLKVDVTFNTKPQGNRAILLDGDKRVDMGVTPATRTIEIDRDYEVEYRCGERSVAQPLSKSFLKTAGKQLSLDAVECKKQASVKHPKENGPRSVAASTDENVPDGYLSVQTQPWSKVFINGTFVKNTPLVKKKLRPGRYKVNVQNDGFGMNRSFNVTIKSGKTTTLVKKLI